MSDTEKLKYYYFTYMGTNNHATWRTTWGVIGFPEAFSIDGAMDFLELTGLKDPIIFNHEEIGEAEWRLLHARRFAQGGISREQALRGADPD